MMEANAINKIWSMTNNIDIEVVEPASEEICMDGGLEIWSKFNSFGLQVRTIRLETHHQRWLRHRITRAEHALVASRL